MKGMTNSLAARALDLFMLDSLDHCLGHPGLQWLWTSASDTELDMKQLNALSADMQAEYAAHMRARSVPAEETSGQRAATPSSPPAVGQKRPRSTDP